MPKVLIADKLSPQAIDVFKQRGVEADVKTGLATTFVMSLIVLAIYTIPVTPLH